MIGLDGGGGSGEGDSDSTLGGVDDIKRFLAPERFGWAVGYWFQTGTLEAPGAISVGRHELAFDASNGDHGQIHFYVDGSTTGACL